MAKYDNIVKKAKYADLVERANREGLSEISQATKGGRFASPRINEAVSEANELVRTIDASSEILDIPDKIQAIAQASRERRFTPPQIHQPGMGTRADVRESMPGRKPLIWEEQPQFEEPREVMGMPRRQEADPITQAVVQTLSEPIMKLYEGVKTIGISAREKDKTYEGIKKALEAVPKRHLESAMAELRSDEDIMRDLSATYGEGAIDILGGLLHTVMTPFTVPFAGVGAGLREVGLEPVAQGIEQTFDLPFAAIRFGSEIVGEGLDKMGFDFHRLENTQLDKKAADLLTEIGGIASLIKGHAKAKSYVEKKIPIPEITKDGLKFKDTEGRTLDQETAKAKIEEIKAELPKDIINDPRFEVVGRSESGKPKLRYKGEAESPKPEVKAEPPKTEPPKTEVKAESPEILITNRSAAERMINQGKSDTDIAKALNIKPETVASVRTEMPRRIISFDLYEQTRKSAFEKGQRMGAGIDPTLLKDYSIIGAYHLENLVRAGIQKGQLFKDWSEKIVEDLGDKVKPHLKEIWDEVNKRKDLNDFKMRRFGERVSEKPEFKDIASDIKKSPDSYYKPQSRDQVRQEVKRMTDEQLDITFDAYIKKVSEIDNTGVMAGLEKVDRQIKRGENPIETIQQLNKAGTPLGQLISQYAELKGVNNRTIASIIESKFTEKGLTLTDGLRGQLNKLTDAYTKSNKRVHDFEKVLEETPTMQNIKRLKELQKESVKNQEQLLKFTSRYLPREIRDMWISSMKASLMAVTSLFKNPAWNIFGELMPRQFGKLLVTPFDYAHSKITGKPRTHNIGGRYYVEMVKGGWEGIKQSAEIMLSGRHEFINEKYDISRGFQPIKAWVDLFSKDLPKNAKGQTPIKYRFGKLLEGTVGFPAEMIFRGLPFGDLPFKTATMRTVAYEIGKSKGLKGEELKKFIERPDKETMDLMAMEGERSVFMQSNRLSNVISGMQKDIGSGLDKVAPGLGGIGEVIFAANFPYHKVPTNALFLMMDYSFPVIPLTKAVRFSIEARRGGESAFLYRRQAYTELGKALTGAMMWAVSDWMAANNVITGEISSNPKERSIEYQTKYPRSINLTRLSKILQGEKVTDNWESGDRIIDYETFGGLGVNFMIMDAYRRKYGKGILDTKSLDEFINVTQTALMGGTKFLANQSIAQGVHGLFGALLSNNPKVIQRWFSNMSQVVITPALPNTLSALDRAQQDYIVEKKGDTFAETFLNVVEMKNPFNKTKDPLYVTDIWGRPVKRPSDFLGKASNIFYFFKTRVLEDDPVTFELYDIYTRTGDKDVLPSEVSNGFTVDNERIELSIKEHKKFEELVGSKRLQMAKEYMASDGYLKKTDEERVKKFVQIYRKGYDEGKSEYMETYMGYKPKNKKKIKIIF